MRKARIGKIKEALISVLPITVIVLAATFTPLVTLTPQETLVFGISAFALILGIALFNLGADLAITPYGRAYRRRSYKVPQARGASDGVLYYGTADNDSGA